MSLLFRPRLGLLLLATLPCLPTQGAVPGEHAAAGRTPESQVEKDWVDDRWSRTDHGPVLATVLATPAGTVAKGLAIRVGDQDEGAVCFDSATCTWRAGWTGGFLKFDPGRFGLIRTPALGGPAAWSFPNHAGGTVSSNHYNGLHRHGRRVVLEYQSDGRRVLESPWLFRHGDTPVFTRSLELGPSSQPTRLLLAHLPKAQARPDTGPRALLESPSGQIAVSVLGGNATLSSDQGRVIATFPALDRPLRAQVLLWHGTNLAAGPAFAAVEPAAPPDDLAALSQPGPARWLPELTTRGQRGLDTDLLAVDTLTAPYDNPWKALLFMAGVDFTADGAAYVGTIHGDVWRVTGLDDSLQTLRWKRFATGLHQPLGLKVRDGKVFVLGRDQITRLHDRNNDGEADFYENFCNAIRTSKGSHDYVTCLEQDNAGNFYYIDPEGLHRVSPDGRQVQTIATGWRNPNGMGVSPDGRILTAAPQQGNWTPSSQICEAKPGGYYGFGGPRITPDRPLGYDAPLCWIPHRVDNSSGSQVWVPPGQWGPLGGQMLHLLWGRCGLMLVLRDVVNGIPQGAVVPLPGRFLSGPNRGTFRAADGHLYLAGSSGWQTSAAKDGALHRIRYTGRPVRLPIAWHAHRNGLTLSFAQPLDPTAAADPGSFGLKQWNYRYAAAYGSKDWSVTDPKKEGRDEVEVRTARLLPDGKTVFLAIPDLQPVMQMEIKYSLATADGAPLRGELWLTLNALDAPRE
ncbi:MAG: hypothetical protein RJA22_2038 [Verrucomicrobiota bacterium]|jgi:hypothetical protein